MSFEQCIAEIIKAGDGVLTKAQASQIMELYKSTVENLSKKDKFATGEMILQKAHEIITDRSTLSQLHENQTRLRQALIAEQHENNFRQVDQTKAGMPVYKAFHKAMRTAESHVETSRRQTYFEWNSIINADQGAAIPALKTPDMFNQAVDLFFQPRASRPLNGVSPSVQALLRAMDTTHDFIYVQANKLGAYLNKRPSILFNARDLKAELVGAMEKDDFVARAAEALTDDAETHWQHGIYSEEELTQRLERIYDLATKQLTSDVHGQYADGMEPLVKTFYGKTINKLSDSIFDLPWRDGQAFRQFYADFNGGDLAEHLMGNIGRSGRNLGMVRAFGPVPELGFQDMVKAAKAASGNLAEQKYIEGKFGEAMLHANADGPLIQALHKFGADQWKFIGPGAAILEKSATVARAWLTEPNPETWFKVLAGETDRVHDQAIANLGRSARGFVSLSRLLGYGHLTQWGDFANTGALFGNIADNPVEAFQATLHSYLKSYDIVNNKYDADAIQALATSLDVMHGNQLDMYFTGDDAAAGNVARGQAFMDKAFTYTGMGRLDWMRLKCTNEFINAHMASALESDFASARPELLRMMQEVGLTQKEWDGLKTGIRRVDTLDGRNHLLPEMIEDADIRYKYLRMLNEAGRISVPRPGAMEQAIINRGTLPGTAEGEILRTVGLFKTFSIAMATRTLPYVAEHLDWKQKIGWGSTMLLTYMMRDAVKQVLQGRTPKDWRSADTWKEAIVFSGMGAVYGDMLATDMSKFGPAGGVAGYMAGPLISGSAQSVADLGHTLFSDAEPGTKAAKTLKFGLHTAALDNLPVATAAMNRMFIFNLMENLEPGWTQKHMNGLKAKGQSEL